MQLRFGQFLEQYEEHADAQSLYEQTSETYRAIAQKSNDEKPLKQLAITLKRRLILARQLDESKAAELQKQFTAEMRDLVTQAAASPSAEQAVLAQTELARWLEQLGDKRGAIDAYSQAMEARANQLIEANDMSALVTAYFSHSDAVKKLGNLKLADAAMADGLRAAKKLNRSDPNHLATLLACHVLYGDLKRERKDDAAAVALYREASTLPFPKDATVFGENAIHEAYSQFERLTRRLLATEDVEATEAALLRRLDLAKRIVAASEEQRPSKSVAESHLAIAELYETRGDLQQAAEQYDAAIATFETVFARGYNDELFNNIAAAMLKAYELRRQLAMDDDVRQAAQRMTRFLGSWVAMPRNRRHLLSESATYLEAAPWYAKLGDNDQAFAAYRKSVELKERALSEKKESLRPLIFDYYNLSVKAHKLNDWASANAAMADCRRIGEQLLKVPADARMQTAIHARSALINAKLQDRDASLRFARLALAVELPDDKGFVRRESPLVLKLVSELTRSLQKLDAPDEVAAGYERQLTIARRLANVVGNSTSLIRLGEVQGYYAYWRKEREEYDESLKLYQQKVETAEQLIRKEDTPAHQMLLADAIVGKGNVFARQERYAEAVEVREADVEIRKKLFDTNPSPHNRRALYLGHYTLARTFSKQKKNQLAIDHTRKAVELVEPLLADDSDSTSASLLSRYLSTLAWYQMLSNSPDDAIASAKRSLQLNPSLNGAAINLLQGYLLKGDIATAKEVFEQYQETKIGNKAFTEVLLDDINELREDGIDRPAMSQFEEFIRKQQQGGS